MRKFVLVLLLGLLLTPAVLAQIVLNPGQTTFSVIPIILQNIPVDPKAGDYCGNPEKPETLVGTLGLRGEKILLNVRWNARTVTGDVTDIGVDCYLNCGNPGTNIDANCQTVQKCTYRGPTGLHSCTIQNPNYQLKDRNNATCKFFLLATPTIQLLPYPAKTFYLFDFSVSAPTVSTTVGQSLDFEVSVRNFGLFNDNFTVNVTPLQKANEIVIDRNVIVTEKLFCGEVGKVFPSVIMLFADTVPMTTQVKQTQDTNTCTTDSDCNYLSSVNAQGKCVQGLCVKRFDSTITAGVTTLPEFDLFGFLAIIFSAFVIFFLRSK